MLGKLAHPVWSFRVVMICLMVWCFLFPTHGLHQDFWNLYIIKGDRHWFPWWFDFIISFLSQVMTKDTTIDLPNLIFRCPFRRWHLLPSALFRQILTQSAMFHYEKVCPRLIHMYITCICMYMYIYIVNYIYLYFSEEGVLNYPKHLKYASLGILRKVRPCSAIRDKYHWISTSNSNHVIVSNAKSLNKWVAPLNLYIVREL